MSRVFINEWKRAINTGTVIAVIGVMFCICFDSWNDLVSAMQSGNSVWCVYYFTSNSAFGGMCRKYILPVLRHFLLQPVFARKERAGRLRILFPERECGDTAL